MAEHSDRLRDLRKRIVESRRKLAVSMTKSSSDDQGHWSDFQSVDAMLQTVDRAIEDEENKESVYA